ncbi:MAG: C-GCAxxG-C-C family (seleno)protein [Candidatus Omnitrophota bacterium]
MEIKLAKDFYAAGGYNCAQAILKAFQSYNKLTDSDISKYHSASAGRAEGGLCGALYAAKLQLDTKEKKSQLEESFKNIAGHLTCRDIKINKTLTCSQCVETAAKLLNQLRNPD